MRQLIRREEPVTVRRKRCLLAPIWLPLGTAFPAKHTFELAEATSAALLGWLSTVCCVLASGCALSCLLHFLEAILQVGVVQSLSSSDALCGQVFKEASEEVHCKLRARAAFCNLFEHGMLQEVCVVLCICNVVTLQLQQGVGEELRAAQDGFRV